MVRLVVGTMAMAIMDVKPPYSSMADQLAAAARGRAAARAALSALATRASGMTPLPRWKTSAALTSALLT